jgi:hypothetical protein
MGTKALLALVADLSDDEEFDLTFLMQKRNILKRYCDVLKPVRILRRVHR